MDTARITCSSCGATNRADAQWCALCHAAFSPRPGSSPVAGPPPPPPVFPAPPPPPPAPGAGAAPPVWLRPRPSSTWLRVAVAFLVVLIGAGFVDGVKDFGRLHASALEAPADPRGFRFTGLDPDTGGPVRLDPCTPVHYVVNTSTAPRGGVRDIRTAIAKTEEATGIDFVYDGPTNEVASPTRPLFDEERYGDRWAPVLIAWAPADPALFPGDAVGTTRAPYVANDDGRLVTVTATISLKAGTPLDGGFGAGRTWGKVVLHELGHVVGLNHVDDPAEVMNPSMVSSPASWGPGDLAGLRQLGELAGCVTVPELP